MRSLPIGPEEAFVLSRVDGSTSKADIAAATGLDGGRIDELLDRLVELGAVTFGAAKKRAVEESNNRIASEAAKIARPVIEAPVGTSSSASHPAAALYDPAELDEEVDIELPRRREILDTFYRLDQLTHYELLKIDSTADKKAIKSAYYEIVTIYHPDKYFGKNVGSFKPKLERIFERLTDAHDALTRPKQREEYDAYLAARRRTESLDVDPAAAMQKDIERVRRELEEQARLAERAARAPTRPSTVPPKPVDPDARRRALARKLGRTSAPPNRKSSAPPAGAAQVKEMVAEDLRRRYEARLADMKDGQVQKYIDAADKALEQKDNASAANALRIAVSLAPDDEGLAKRLEEIQAEVSAELADTYLQSAQYEERNKRYEQAAESYKKASRGRLPGRGKILERAAYCTLLAEGDLRTASELAKEAVSILPESADVRVTLARIYLALDLKKSAMGEFERAHALAPQDDTIKDWIKRMKKGEV